MTRLTIIIPFLNEGDEVENTVISIKETAITNPTILLINDGSDDNFDYESVALRHNCICVKNDKRLGSAPSRDIGVAACETPYFVFFDGHMRLYEKGWDEKVIRLLTENPRSLLCGQSRRLMRDDNGNVVTQGDTKIPYGAFLNMKLNGTLNMIWNEANIAQYTEFFEIPCVLGAAYACSKTYWEYLGGMKGLLYYGLEEQLISIKVWLEGGQCLLVKDWVTGHLYRKAFPYEVPVTTYLYNQLLLLELLFPYPIKNDFFSTYKSVYPVEFEKAYALLIDNYKDIRAQKNYLKTIFHNKMDYFLAMNEKIKMLN